MEEKQEFYLLATDYDNDYIYGLFKFNHYVGYSQRIEIQRKIDEIKNELDEWQVEDVVEKLHDYFDFEECEIGDKSFLI